MLRFVAVGHVTNDRLASGLVPGGSAFYSTIAASRLGARAHVITSCGEDWVGRDALAAAGVTVEIVPARETTSFENVYVGGARRGRLLALAAPLEVPDAPDLVFACPVAGEIARPAGAAGLQGWLRRFGADGLVSPELELDWSIFAACHTVFLSIEDLGGNLGVIDALRRVVPTVVCTYGRDGARVYSGAEVVKVDAAPATEVDPTGAGDVFATAFLLARAGGAGVTRAAAFAARAGAIAVEAVGVGALSRLASLTV